MFRGETETADKFLLAQEEYFKHLTDNSTDPDSLNPSDTGEGFDIVQYANDIINGKVPAYLPDAEVVSDE